MSIRRIGREPTKSTETKCKRGTQIKEHKYEVSLGRPIVDDSKDDSCLNIASMWLARCTQYHGTECRELQDVKLPTRLLHIPHSDGEMIRLENTGGQSGQYVALSHCWGKSGIDDQTKTTSTNMDKKMCGFLESSLPESFQDAITIARKLGFEYIWIDALCIIQDDCEDWTREASQMAEVYGNASLTISADRAPYSKHGIFGKRSTQISLFRPTWRMVSAGNRRRMGYNRQDAFESTGVDFARTVPVTSHASLPRRTNGMGMQNGDIHGGASFMSGTRGPFCSVDVPSPD